MARKKKDEVSAPVTSTWQPKPYIPKKYLLQTRYEHWSPTGKIWCKWYGLTEGDTEQELNKYAKNYDKNSMNRKMHLKNDFQIIINPKWAEENN